MHIGILFYSDTIFMAKTDPGLVMGRFVANNDFVKALLLNQQKLKITLFVTTEAEKIYLQDYLTEILGKHPAKIITLLQAQEFFKKNRVDVIHLLDPNLYRGFYLRHQVARYSMVVTGVTHSLGHAPFLDWLVLNSLGNAQSFDSLICTTPTAKETIDKMVLKISDHLKNGIFFRRDIIPLGVDVDSFSGCNKSIRDELNISGEAVVLLCFSRFSHRHKVDLIPLFLVLSKLLKKTKKQVKLLLAGAEGKENNIELLKTVACEYQIEEHVVFVKNPNDSYKRDLFNMADIFLAWSDNVQETFGLTVIEAMASGLPVVASDWNGYRSLVTDKENGYLIPTCALKECSFINNTAPLQVDSVNHMYLAQSVAIDQEAAIEKLVDLIDNENKRKDFSLKAKERAKKYDWKRVVIQYKRLWEELVTESQKHVYQPNRDFLTLDYHHIFSHYASSVLTAKDKVTVTQLGQEVLLGRVNIRKYTGMEEILDSKLLAFVLKETIQTQTIDCLINKARSFFGEHMIHYHVMWLYKYGFVSVWHH